MKIRAFTFVRGLPYEMRRHGIHQSRCVVVHETEPVTKFVSGNGGKVDPFRGYLVSIENNVHYTDCCRTSHVLRKRGTRDDVRLTHRHGFPTDVERRMASLLREERGALLDIRPLAQGERFVTDDVVALGRAAYDQEQHQQSSDSHHVNVDGRAT